MIRRAELPDIPELMALARACYDEMNFDVLGFHFDPVQIENTFRRAVSDPGVFIFTVAETVCGVCGIFLAAITDTTFYFKGRKFAQEIVWHAKPAISSFTRGKIMLALLKDAENEMVRRGGMPFYLSSDVRHQFDGVGDYLLKHGYTEMCRYWYKGV